MRKRRTISVLETITMNQPKRRRRLDPLLHALKHIRRAQSQERLQSLLTQGLETVELPFWSLLVGTKEPNSQFSATDLEALCNCNTKWFDRYIKNNWILIDPFVLHTQHSNLPMMFPYDVEGESDGQKEFLKIFYENGFLCGLAVPIHLAQERLALIYAGTSATISREELLAKVPFVAALGQEAAIWVEDQSEERKRNLVSPLSDRELEFLILVRKGFSTSEIATLMSVSSTQTNNVFRRINEKLGTKSRSAAADLAEKLGFHRLSMLTKSLVLYPDCTMPNGIEKNSDNHNNDSKSMK